ncbi:MAG TPA: glycosyltransferase family 1 protein [Candidatus Acidoferrum sp.]|nr:glycosyltransferase family 1 protein [Candidatus Acidoferrum sp.]
MRVGIDAHCLGQKKTGNETYTYGLVKHLAGLDRDGIEYTVYLGGGRAGETRLPSKEWVRSRALRPANPFVRIPIGLAIQSRAQKLDVLHAQYLLPHHLRCRTVLTVHDVLYERFPEYFTRWDCYRHKMGVRWSCRRADHVITVSEASKRDLVELYGLDPSQVSVTYQGADERFRPQDQVDARNQVRARYGIEQEFLLYVGAIQPRKNIPKLLSAFASVKAERKLPHKLVMVGPKAWKSRGAFEALQNNPVKRDVIVTGYVPPDDLPHFYNAAEAFAYVSRCEGFGLPVVEAMACGTPTVTSRGSSLEEVAGDAAVLVDAGDEQAIAAGIEKVLLDGALRAQLREKGLARSKEFNGRKMAIQTQEIYRGVL